MLFIRLMNLISAIERNLTEFVVIAKNVDVVEFSDALDEDHCRRVTLQIGD